MHPSLLLTEHLIPKRAAGIHHRYRGCDCAPLHPCNWHRLRTSWTSRSEWIAHLPRRRWHHPKLCPAVPKIDVQTRWQPISLSKRLGSTSRITDGQQAAEALICSYGEI